MRQTSLPALLVIFLAGCTAAPPDGGSGEQGGTQAAPAQEEQARDASPAPLTSREVARAMRIADILYAARQAFEDNRLMLPEDDNAYDRYQQVLRMDAGNEMARQGIEDIVARYVSLADEAMAIGDFEQADSYLDWATAINGGVGIVARGRERLAEARQRDVRYFELDPRQVSRQSQEVMGKLGDIARLIRREQARFLITSRTDAEGRWMYRVMREAVDGYRLRGNITLGEQPSVQVQIPST